jgi:hypothetical protein
MTHQPMDLPAVRAKIAAGILPRTDWDWTRLLVGVLDRACSICAQPTSATNMAVECYGGPLIFTLHPDCYLLWEEAREIERQKRAK